MKTAQCMVSLWKGNPADGGKELSYQGYERVSVTFFKKGENWINAEDIKFPNCEGMFDADTVCITFPGEKGTTVVGKIDMAMKLSGFVLSIEPRFREGYLTIGDDL
jgi:hypothetical protein